MNLSDVHAETEKIEQALGSVVVGLHDVVRQTVATLYSGGHLLLEGVPGTGKTLLAKALARAVGTDFRRIQFTPDLMPADILGTEMYQMNSQSFQFRKGPIFTTILLADEINRTPPKTQAGLLETMEERAVSIGGQTYPLSPAFTVLATQNPLEFEGTYPLPEAQVDRFMAKILMPYPSIEENVQILDHYNKGEDLHQKVLTTLKPVTTVETVLACRQVIRALTASQPILVYISNLIAATRSHTAVQLGASPRAATHLLLASKACAGMAGRDFVTPEDVKAMALPILRHRLILNPEAQVDGLTSDQVLQEVLGRVDVPR